MLMWLCRPRGGGARPPPPTATARPPPRPGPGPPGPGARPGPRRGDGGGDAGRPAAGNQNVNLSGNGGLTRWFVYGVTHQSLLLGSMPTTGSPAVGRSPAAAGRAGRKRVRRRERYRGRPVLAQKRFEELVDDLRSWWPWRWRPAVAALVRLGDARAVSPLVATLEDALLMEGSPKAPVALQALLELGAADSIRHLLPAALWSNQGDVRQAAAAALDHLSPTHAVEAAVRTLEAPFVYGFGRDTAARVLCLHGKAVVYPVLEAVGCEFELGVGYWSDKVWRDLRLKPQGGSDPVMILADERAIPVLVQSLAKKKACAGRARVVAGWVGLAPATVDALLRLVEQPDSLVRTWAAEALGRLGDARNGDARKRLAALLAGADAGGRVAAAIGLAHLGDPCGLDILAGALRDPTPCLRAPAAEALGALGARAAPALSALRNAAGREMDAEAYAACREALAALERALRDAPAELEAAPAPAGRGTELEAAGGEGRGTEPEAAEAPGWQPGR